MFVVYLVSVLSLVGLYLKLNRKHKSVSKVIML